MKKLGNIFVFISIGAMFLMPSNIVKADSAGSVTSKAGISFHGENPETSNLSDTSRHKHNSRSEAEYLPSLSAENDFSLVLLGLVIIFLIQYIRLYQDTHEARKNKIRDNSLL